MPFGKQIAKKSNMIRVLRFAVHYKPVDAVSIFRNQIQINASSKRGASKCPVREKKEVATQSRK